MKGVNNNRVLIHIEDGQLIDVLVESGSTDQIYIVDDGTTIDRVSRKHPAPDVSALIDSVMAGANIDNGRPVGIRDIVQPSATPPATDAAPAKVIRPRKL